MRNRNAVVQVLSEAAISRIIEMAWEDRTPFEAIEAQFCLDESGVVSLMRLHMKPSSLWPFRPFHCGQTGLKYDLN